MKSEKDRNNFLKRISTNLRQMRTDLGITLDELGAATGIHPNTLGKYEWGSVMPNAYYVYLIANYFGCDYDELFE